MHPYDLIGFMLTGLSHVLLYIRLIRYKQLSYLMVVVLSVILTILLGFIVTVTGYPEFNTIVLVVFLLALGLIKPELTFMQNLYFTLISTVSITLTKMVLIKISTELFMLSPFNLYLWTGSLLHLIVSALIVLIIVLCYKPIQKFAEFILASRLYYFSYGLFVIGLFLALILTYPTSNVLATIHEEHGEISYIAAFILFFILLLFILISSHLAKQRLLTEHQKDLDQELLDYVDSLERAHDELASFRHDYINVLLVLDEGVRRQDMKQIERVYQDVIAPTSQMINHHELDIVKLSAVLIPEVKSLLSVKVIAAQQEQVKVTIDIPEQITAVAIPLIDFIRMISIILDNALEEVVHSKEKALQIAFFELEDRQYFIVKNSCTSDLIDMQKIYEKGYSTKGKHQGYGLFSLKRMVDGMDNLTLETTCKAGYFTQKLIFRKLSSTE